MLRCTCEGCSTRGLMISHPIQDLFRNYMTHPYRMANDLRADWPLMSGYAPAKELTSSLPKVLTRCLDSSDRSFDCVNRNRYAAMTPRDASARAHVTSPWPGRTKAREVEPHPAHACELPVDDGHARAGIMLIVRVTLLWRYDKNVGVPHVAVSENSSERWLACDVECLPPTFQSVADGVRVRCTALNRLRVVECCTKTVANWQDCALKQHACSIWILEMLPHRAQLVRWQRGCSLVQRAEESTKGVGDEFDLVIARRNG